MNVYPPCMFDHAIMYVSRAKLSSSDFSRNCSGVARFMCDPPFSKSARFAT
jgi:hypothetical protein